MVRMASASHGPAALLFAAAATLPALLGCARLHAEHTPPAPETVLAPYPRHDDPDAVSFNDLPVSLYFFSQSPPPLTKVVKPVRVLFRAVGDGNSCRAAGVGGLKKLQRVALRNRANAVVNIRATWEGRQLGDALQFGCRRVGDTYSLVWEGALASLPETPDAPVPIPEEPPAEPPVDDSASARLRELQSLYYQGLITREEFLQRRQTILDGL
jgi:hypothetical protein